MNPSSPAPSGIFDLPSLAAVIRHYRLNQNPKVTITQLADTLSLSRDTLHRLERGEDVGASVVLAVLQALGLQMNIQPIHLPKLEEATQYFAGDLLGHGSKATGKKESLKQ
ncbi:MAG: helix-turn-helix transcriptional regulator [Limnobacter sp.]|nr:helix-turn-helix transcriptional regulator [Limnobacter sp.]